MNISRMLVAVSCAALLLGGAPAAFAQRGGGGHGGGGGGFHGGGMSMMGHGGGVRGMSPGPVIGTRGFSGAHVHPFIHGGNSPFIGGGFGHGGNFVQRGAFVHGHGFVGPVHFFHPYYAFHPRVSLGFGLWAGYPFAYPYAFYYPYYSYSYYPYSYDPYTYAQPSQTSMGGMSFDITPSNAELFVDNTPVGTVGEFTPTTQPLGLEAGHHHIEIRAAGYQTMSFDVDIIAGQVIPYQGSLEQ
jgi:hypothetical protein